MGRLEPTVILQRALFLRLVYLATHRVMVTGGEVMYLSGPSPEVFEMAWENRKKREEKERRKREREERRAMKGHINGVA